MARRGRRRLVIVAAVGAVAVVLLAGVQFMALVGHVRAGAPVQMRMGLAAVPALLSDEARQEERTVDAYRGYGTWVDVYDFLPSPDGSTPPELDVDVVEEMVRRGVQTLYLQAAQLDEAAPGLLVDRRRLGQMLVRAHQAGLDVVGWYVPKFHDVGRDLAHLRAIAAFEVLGHRFDGVAVDIEWTDSVPDPAERSNKLVELSRRLRTGLGRQPIGAIVLPPVQIEEVNPTKWPGFPWRELADLYDVWLPMGYWTEREPDSEHHDGGIYTGQNIKRLRRNLDNPDLLVHAIGGIGDEVTPPHAERFAQAVNENHAIGGSIYDWHSLDGSLHDVLADRLRRPAH